MTVISNSQELNQSMAGITSHIAERIHFLSQIAHPIRHGILQLLLQKKKLSVKTLMMHLDKSQTLISYHLRCLKENKLVNCKKSDDDGRMVLYHLYDSQLLVKLFLLADEYLQQRGNV